MQLSHLNASISERTISNGTKHEAQRIFPAARVASTVGRSSSFAEGAWRRSKEGPLRYCIPVLQLCIPVLHLNTVDIVLSSLFYFAILVLIDDPQNVLKQLLSRNLAMPTLRNRILSQMSQNHT